MAVVRYAEPSDSQAMGAIHVRAWQAAYRSDMPDDYLDGLDADRRAGIWEEALRRGRGAGECIAGEGSTTALIVEDGGHVAGIAAVGGARGETERGLGEVGMLNMDPDAWGRGLGRQLLDASVDELRWQGFTAAMLWVLQSNVRARRLYERAGWVEDGASKEDDRRGFLVREVRYRRLLHPTGEDLCLRSGTASDAGVVLALYEEAARWLTDEGIDQWSPGGLPAERVELLLRSGETTVVDGGTHPRACMILLARDSWAWDDPDGQAAAGYAHDLIVARSHAGQGLGRRLLQRAERRVVERGGSKVRLECVTTNAGLRRYYERAGYRCVGETDFGGRDWAPCALYEKAVGPTADRVPTA